MTRRKVRAVQIFFSCLLCSFAFGQSDATGASTMVLPVGCSVQKNVLYTTVGGWNGYLDLYLPRDRSKPVPIVLLFHGGGWNHGAKEDVQRGALPFLKLGWAVANVEYRLLNVASAPAAVGKMRGVHFCGLWLTRRPWILIRRG